jgi:hypothetical protein
MPCIPLRCTLSTWTLLKGGAGSRGHVITRAAPRLLNGVHARWIKRLEHALRDDGIILSPRVVKLTGSPDVKSDRQYGHGWRMGHQPSARHVSRAGLCSACRGPATLSLPMVAPPKLGDGGTEAIPRLGTYIDRVAVTALGLAPKPRTGKSARGR